MRDDTILLVDSDGDCEQQFARVAAQIGYNTIRVGTSREALALLSRELHDIALVAIDIDPGAHGIALLEAVSACAERPPIIVLTSLEDVYAEPIARREGADACLGKPIETATLARTLQCALGHSSSTCDFWGHPVPVAITDDSRVGAVKRGIRQKLSPFVSKRARKSKRERKAAV